MITVVAYTDGSCNAKNRFGGAGVYAVFEVDGGTGEMEISKGFVDTTISRMELMALSLLLEEIDYDNVSDIMMTVYSDSQYVVNSINKRWVRKWMKEGESRYAGLPDAENKRILLRMWVHVMELIDRFPVGQFNIEWVRGHAGVEGNERADKLAGMGYREAMAGMV